MSRKKNEIDELDDETLALLAWCTEVEAHLEWYTDMFYDGLSPAEAAKQALA